MYLRAVHAETDTVALQSFIQQNQLGILITSLPSDNFPTIQCSHIPWVLDVTPTGLGKLRGHIARANPHCKALIEAVNTDGQIDTEVLVLFNGAVDAYVTPKFYTETKPTTGKVVPTWNYSAVQVYGRARIFHDGKSTEAGEWLQKQISDLTNGLEAKTEGKAWEVEDAPTAYVEILKKAIMGIEIDIERLEGKFKMSQEMSKGDRDGVVEGFKKLGTDEGREMARVVEERGNMKDAKKAGV